MQLLFENNQNKDPRKQNMYFVKSFIDHNAAAFLHDEILELLLAK